MKRRFTIKSNEAVGEKHSYLKYYLDFQNKRGELYLNGGEDRDYGLYESSSPMSGI